MCGLHRQQAVYSPEQFLPCLDGVLVEYDNLTLDLFMLGFFHILELELPVDERKMRQLLCFEVFDRVGNFPQSERTEEVMINNLPEVRQVEWSFSNEDICKYIDRSFAFRKEKEAEIFDFE